MKGKVIAACLALAAAGLAQQYQPWPDSGLGNARVRLMTAPEIYPEGVPAHDYTLPMTLVQLDKTNWTEARALRQLRKTAAIFKTCGIVLDGVELARGTGPEGRHDIDMMTLYPGSEMPADVVDFAGRMPASASWPRVFLIGRLLGDTVLARAYRQGDVSDEEARRYPYMNTAWVAFRAHWEERAEKEYSSLAHELAHVLCRCGHSGGEDRHLLHEKRNFLGSRVLEEDCVRMRESPLLNASKESL